MAKVALLVGVSEYQAGLNPLPGAVKDIEAMRRVLQHQEMGGFDEVTTLSNPDPMAMQEAIETLFSSREKEDLALLFFSGHGVKDDSGRLYFASRLTRKTAKGELVKATAVPASFVQDVMSNSRCKRQVIMLDCCFSGAFAEGMTTKDEGNVNIQDQLGGEGRAVLTSSTSTQYSFEQQGSDLSVYTRYVIEGIETGAADINSDGVISIDELHDYARKKVQEAAPAMKPKIYAVEEGFKIHLAKAPIGDPKLRYRKEVEKCAANGEISSVGKRILWVLCEELGLSKEEAAAIEAEVLKPYLKYKENIQHYQRTLATVLEAENPLSQYTQNELKRFQELLGLRDEDIVSLPKPAIPNLPKSSLSPSSRSNEQEIAEPKTDQRRLEAAMPKTSKVGQRTEVRVMIALYNSPGLSAHLPIYTDAGDLIAREDVTQNNFPFAFPLDPITSKPQSVNVFVVITAPDFQIEQTTRSLHLSPEFDSGIVTFFLMPRVRQQNGRVVVELFKDEHKTILLNSLTLITEVRGQQDDVAKIVWRLVKLPFSTPKRSFNTQTPTPVQPQLTNTVPHASPSASAPRISTLIRLFLFIREKVSSAFLTIAAIAAILAITKSTISFIGHTPVPEEDVTFPPTPTPSTPSPFQVGSIVVVSSSNVDLPVLRSQPDAEVSGKQIPSGTVLQIIMRHRGERETWMQVQVCSAPSSSPSIRPGEAGWFLQQEGQNLVFDTPSPESLPSIQLGTCRVATAPIDSLSSS